MSHKSEDCVRLKRQTREIRTLKELLEIVQKPTLLLLWFPPWRTDSDAEGSQNAFEQISHFCETTHDQTTVCILTSPPDAARLLPFLETSLRYQLWIAVKTKISKINSVEGQLDQRHSALLVMTRYRASLKHTTTRLAYTFCPACGKTTKDYGGKKHLYNSFGTLLSDVWRDIQIQSSSDIEEIENRLQDIFGLFPYQVLEVLDMRKCRELKPANDFGALNDNALNLFHSRRTLPQDSRLINGDCLTSLAAIPDNSIDFCFADPPYNIQKKYDHWNDALEAKDYFAWCDKWLSELARVIKPGATVSVVNIPLWAVRHYQYLSKILHFQNWIAWDGLSLPVRMIMPSHYAILCFSKGKPRDLPGLNADFLASPAGQNSLPAEEFFCVRTSCISSRSKLRPTDRAVFSDLWYDIHRLKHNSRRVDHPCQLPPALMRRLYILFTRPNEIILDCFDGAGTSTLVAHQMNRRFIGIELSAQYHKIAKERHDMILRGEDPFGKRECIPQAKNSRVERLTKQRYMVSKKLLQLEVRKIAKQLGRIPTRDEIKSLSKHPIEYFDNYFVSWGEVCAAARHDGMSELPRGSIDSNDDIPQAEFTFGKA
jgi:site-specific DNA-methyltransferase (adenine-specific)